MAWSRRPGSYLKQWIFLTVGLVGMGWGPCVRQVSAQLADDVLIKVKHATVHLNVKLANGSNAEGTGWFVEPGLIITNAHVLNMHSGDKRFPQKLEVTIDSGEKNSKTISAKFQGAAYDADLMLLKVDLPPERCPEPLVVNSDGELLETQSVFVFGFPLGKALGKAITVSKSSISSLRKDGDVLKEIQLEGGINPGNSGGPIVNSNGEVIGVAVGSVAKTSVHLGIPAEFVSQMVNGKFLTIKTEQSYLDGTQIKLPLRVAVLDPLKRISEVKIEYWTAPKVDPTRRSGSYSRPEPAAEEGPIQVIDVPADATGARAIELALAPLSDETSVYFVRATVKDGRGRTYWSAPISNLRPVPLERRDFTMKYLTKPGVGRSFQISNEAAFKKQVGTRTDSLSMSVRVEAQPTWAAADAEGDTVGRLKFSSVTLGMKQNGESVKAKELFNPLGAAFLKTSANVRLSAEGAVIYAEPDLRQAEPTWKAELEGISDQVLQTLELLSVPSTQRTLQVSERLRVQRTLLIGLAGLYVPAQADVKYQYQGIRQKYKEQTAYFDISADLRPRRGDDTRLNGRVHGILEVSVETGLVISGNYTANVDFDTQDANRGRVSGTLTSALIAIDPRPKSNLAPKDLDQHTTLSSADSKFVKGQIVYALAEKNWNRAEVLDVNAKGLPKVHLIGWSTFWDSVFPLERIRILKPGSELEADSASSSEATSNQEGESKN